MFFPLVLRTLAPLYSHNSKPKPFLISFELLSWTGAWHSCWVCDDLATTLRLHHNWSSPHQHFQSLAKLAPRCGREPCQRSVIAHTYWMDVPQRTTFSSTPFISSNHFCGQQVKKDISKGMIQLYMSFNTLYLEQSVLVGSMWHLMALKPQTPEAPFF